MRSDCRTDPLAHRLLPYLDGLPVEHCVAADDKEGWVEVYVDLKEVRPSVWNRLSTRTEIRRGQVVMLDILDPRAAGWSKGEPLPDLGEPLDNTIDITPRLAEESELTPVEFEPDRVEVTIVVGVRIGGRKVQEVPLRVALCYPFDLEAILPQACAQAQKQWEAQQGDA